MPEKLKTQGEKQFITRSDRAECVDIINFFISNKAENLNATTLRREESIKLRKTQIYEFLEVLICKSTHIVLEIKDVSTICT